MPRVGTATTAVSEDLVGRILTTRKPVGFVSEIPRPAVLLYGSYESGQDPFGPALAFSGQTVKFYRDGSDIRWKTTQRITDISNDSTELDAASATRCIEREGSAEAGTPSATRGIKRED